MNCERSGVIETVDRPIRVALVTDSISHFEIPLFRLIHARTDVLLKVFYNSPVKQGLFDTEYGQKIEWGSNLLEGYDSVLNPTFSGTKRAVANWTPDVLLIYGYSWPGIIPFIIGNWLRGFPQVHRGTLNYHRDPRRPIIGRILRPIGRALLSLFDAHHYGGTYSRKVLLGAGAREDSLFFVPYSIDTRFFISEAERPRVKEAAKSLRKQLGWSEDCPVVLFIAQHNWFKGPDIAMECFVRLAERYPEMKFLIVGSGRETVAMKSVAADQLPKGSFHFSGFVPSLETPKYYLASDLVLCSSRYETWARMLNEAMLCRCPAVVSEVVPAAGDLVVDGETGYVVCRPDVELLSQAVARHFSKSLEARNQMNKAAQKKALEFSYESWLDNAVSALNYAFKRRQRY